MLALSYVALRFLHFGALMLIFGNALYSTWFAPSSLHRLMTRRFQRQQKVAAVVTLVSAIMMFALQGGQMGDGWGMWYVRISGVVSSGRNLAVSGCGR
jgi:putative copper resistance protein D